MINDIYEERKRVDEGYNISLSIPKESYKSIYGDEINDQNAKDILENYLQHKDDDGDVHSVKIYDRDESDIIEIQASLQYLGNDHKDYHSRPSHLKL